MDPLLCPKDVAKLLKKSARSAQRLMESGAIRSFRCGPRELRTEMKHVDAYKQRQYTLGARWRRDKI